MCNLGVEVIVFCIVTRLAAEDVARCKSVCKEWRTLLSKHGFEIDHCARSATPVNQRTILTRGLSCFVYTMDFQTGGYGPRSTIPFPFLHGVKGMSILGHKDGLLCVSLNPTKQLLLWNPTTAEYRHLNTPNDPGLCNAITDTIGLYNGPHNDFNVLHVARSSGSIAAKIYSRRLGSWRSVPFDTKPEYAKGTFLWSPGALCQNTLYFSGSEFWNFFVNVVIGFDTKTEQTREIRFPPVSPNCIFEGILANVQNCLQMILVTTVDDSDAKSIGVWSLRADQWYNNFPTPPIPPIPMSTWITIIHYITNGNWLVMSGRKKLYDFPDPGRPLDCFYSGNWFRGDQGAIYTQTITSPFNLT